MGDVLIFSYEFNLSTIKGQYSIYFELMSNLPTFLSDETPYKTRRTRIEKLLDFMSNIYVGIKGNVKPKLSKSSHVKEPKDTMTKLLY